jgi:hypothetical protein
VPRAIGGSFDFDWWELRFWMIVFSFLRDLDLDLDLDLDFDLDFDAAGKVGYIVGRGGLILRSDDAGRRWESVSPPGDAGRAFLPTARTHLKRATQTADFRGGGA